MLSSRISNESVGIAHDGAEHLLIALEAIVKQERPVLPIRKDRLSLDGAFIDPQAHWLVEAAEKAAPVLNPIIPLIGRIDVRNSANFSYVGTGWLIEPDIVVTNRHVAVLIGREERGCYEFYLNHLGERLSVELNYRRQIDDLIDDRSQAFKIEDILYIETNPTKADIAFLKIGRRTDGLVQDRLVLAEDEPSPGNNIAVIGYPARADETRAPDQDLMHKIFAGRFDVKRIAPGEIEGSSGAWTTHDCTTLGGNSGSPLISLTDGRVVGLHFAGAYFLENYAVPVTMIRSYIKDKPWLTPYVVQPATETDDIIFHPQSFARLQAQGSRDAGTKVSLATSSVSVTIPLSITVSLGPLGSASVAAVAGQNQSEDFETVDKASDALRSAVRSARVRAVHPGYLFAVDGSISDTPCVQVLVDPNFLESVKEAAPAAIGGFPVSVRPAGIFDLYENFDEEAGVAIAYDDEARQGEDFSFVPVAEEFEFRCHVGPERSWRGLSEFLAGADSELVASIYEFHAAYIADAVEREIVNGDKVAFTLVMDPHTRGGDDGHDEFNRTQRFAKWQERDGIRFENAFVPIGGGGLVRSSYHIKVSVRDRNYVWLSSGNWTSTSQPKIAAADEYDGNRTIRSGNREWHVVVKNERLSTCFRAHIRQDLLRSRALGGRQEAPLPADIEVDVPTAILEATDLESVGKIDLLEIADVKGQATVEPLLTPDRGGKVYSDAVLRLIHSAQSELLLQVPYITAYKGGGSLVELTDALVKKSREIANFRIILRAENDPVAGAQDLKRRGMDIDRCVRQIGRTHTKGMVVDGKRVLIGSHNWSGLGVTLNRDASLIIQSADVASYFRQAFEIDWKRAQPVKASPAGMFSAGVRPAAGQEPPPGFTRMRLSDLIEG